MFQQKYKKYIGVLTLLILLSVYTHVEAAVLSISSASAPVVVGNIISANIYVNTEGQSINSADGAISFPSDLLEVMSISKSSSIFSLWVEDPQFSNSQGEVSFSGGVPNPGYNGANGKVLSIVFRAKQTGVATVLFSDGSVRANDGLGTNVLNLKIPTSITIKNVEPPEPAAVEPPVVRGAPKAPLITSSTHPQSNKWYNSNNVDLQWGVPGDVTSVSTLVGKNPSSLPSVVYDSPIKNKTISNLEDGVWYFHLRLKNKNGWGTVGVYKIQIDTVPPNPFKITFPDTSTVGSTQPVVMFSTTDALSGIDHYEIRIDDGVFVPVSPRDAVSKKIILSKQDPGDHDLFVKAVDLAGNETIQTAQFTVSSIEPPVIRDYSAELQEGDLLTLRGSTHPLSVVEVTVQNQDGYIMTQTTQSLDSGQFTLTWPKPLGVGVYSLTARVIKNTGEKSTFTNPVTVIVKNSPLSITGSLILNWLSVLVILALFLAGLILFGFYFTHHLRKIHKNIGKKVGSAESSVHQAFDLLRENVRDQIKTLEGAKSERRLTREEEIVIKKLQENLTESEKYLQEKIDEIEKVL